MTLQWSPMYSRNFSAIEFIEDQNMKKSFAPQKKMSNSEPRHYDPSEYVIVDLPVYRDEKTGSRKVVPSKKEHTKSSKAR